MTIALDSSALQQLTAALSAIHNPLTDNAIRAAAQQHIDSLKTSLAAFDLARLGLQLSTGNSELSVRFFGLSLIEYVLRLAWDQLSLDQAHSLKSDIVASFHLCLSAGQQSTYITEKTCTLVAQVAERMWPLNWPEFDQVLRETFLRNAESQYCALLIYKTLMEDTFCYENSIAELRKKDLSVALMAITVDSVVLNTVIRSDREASALPNHQLDVDTAMNLIRADALQNEGWLHRIIKNFVALEQQGGNMEKLKLLSLDIISTVLQWIILEGVESTNVLPLVFELLGSPVHEERIAATECLASLFSRSSLVGEEKYWPVVVTPLFDAPYLLSAVFTSILKLYQCTDWNQIYVALESRVLDEDGYEYLKRIADALAVFGERQLFYKQMVQKPVRFESYIELMYFFTVHPSRMISSIVSPVWNDLASHEHFHNATEVNAYSTRIVNYCIARISEGDSSFITPMAKQYDSMEFDNEHDKKACIDSNRVRYLDILKYFAAIQPFEVFSVVDAHIRALIFGSHEPSNRNEFGFLKSSGLIAIQFEQSSTLIEHTIKYIPNVLDPDLKDHRLLAGVSGLFRDAISLDAKDPLVVRCVLSVIVCIAESVRDPTSLYNCIEKIFKYVTFVLPDETDFKQRGLSLREETKQIRMKAASSLVKLAVSLPDILMTLFDKFLEIIQSYVQSNMLLQFERIKLIEFLFALIHYSSKGFSEKSRVFSSIVEPYVCEWEKMDESPFVSSNSFLDVLGIFKYANQGTLSSEDIKSVEDWRRKLNYNVRSWMMWMKRTSGQPSLWPEYLFRILPKILLLIRAIHSLGDPTAWSAIPSQFRVNISVSENEKEAILKKSSSKLDLLSDSANFLEKTSNWIATIRETCYGLVGLMTGFGQKFYSIPNVSSIISNNVLSSTNFLDNKHWKSLLSTVIRPVLMNCPSTAHNEVLANIIPPFSEFIQARLDSEWKMLEVSKQGGSKQPGDDDEVGEEIIAEKLLRELTRSYADLLVVIASPDEGKPHTSKGQELVVVEGSVFSYVMTNMIVFQTVFGGLLHIMRLKDTISCRKAIVTIIKAVPILMKTQNAAVFSFLGDSVMMSSLEVFHDGYFQEVHNEAISLMGDIYLALRGAGNPAAYQTLSALPAMNSTALQTFDVKFTVAEKSKKERNVILREFLKGIKGTSVSEAFKQFDTKTKPKPQLVRNTRNRDVLDANDENVAVLEGLF